MPPDGELMNTGLKKEISVIPGDARNDGRERLFSFMTRNALPATDFFRIPPERVVELGIQIEL